MIVQITESQLKKILYNQINEGARKGEYKEKWTEQEQLLAFYAAKFNLKNLGVNTKEIAEIIGTSEGSFVKQTSNFNFLLGKGGLDRPNKMQNIVFEKYSNYTEKYWESRVMAPSSLLFYIGVNKRVTNLLHHNLFFDEDFNQHAIDIYDHPAWPEKPLFYVSVPSLTDDTLAPEGFENLFILIPLAPGLDDNDEKRAFYFDLVMNRLEKLTGQDINKHIIFKRSYAHRDFITDYHAFKGNAYGLANTLLQTAFLKPKLRNKNISNFFFTGQLTTPGPGVPPSLISGEVVAKEIAKLF